jgi:hypothetical protein
LGFAVSLAHDVTLRQYEFHRGVVGGYFESHFPLFRFAAGDVVLFLHINCAGSQLRGAPALFHARGASVFGDGLEKRLALEAVIAV